MAAVKTSKSIYSRLPLDGDHFSTRLLTILPGKEEKPLQCRLRTSKITANTSYEAVSYTWGDSYLNREIFVNGEVFPVTSNLESVLRNLRRHDKKRTIWVDAVCINQSDLVEKGVYVQGIGYIYRMARQVLIWLGPAGPDTEAAMHCIKQNESPKVSPEPDYLHLPESKRDEQALKRMQEWYAARDFMNSASAGLKDLASREWWTRVWVVQEVCMAAGNPLLICGHSSVHWSTFVRLATTHARSSPEWLHILDMADLRQRARKPPRLRNTFPTSDLATRLMEDDLHWLRHTASFKASDPRDKIFALVGLMRGPLRSQIEIDYTSSTGGLIAYLMMNHVAAQQSLDLLALCQFDEASQYPSWLPDLNRPGLPALPSSIPFIDRKDDPFVQYLRPRRGMSDPAAEIHSKTCRLNIIDVHNPDVTASGFLLGTVERIFPTMNGWDRLYNEEFLTSQGINRPAQKRLLRHWTHHLSKAELEIPPSSPCDLTSANINRQLAAVVKYREKLQDEYDYADSSRKEAITCALEYEAFLSRAIFWAELQCHWYPLFSMLAPTDITDDAEAEHTDKFLNWEVTDEEVSYGQQKRAAILHAMKGRHRFTTNTGLIGLGPPGMLENDEIVLFDASSFGFAIRRFGTEYKLIGQVLVCSPLLPRWYPDKTWLEKRPTNYPECWREPTRHEFVLE